MNEAQQILDDSVSRLFADAVTREILTQVEETTWEPALWQAISEMGLPLALVSEARDGMGGTWRDAFIIARACGRYAMPLPVGEQVIANWLLEQAGLAPQEEVLGLVPEVVPAGALNATGVTISTKRIPWGRHARYFVGLSETHEVLLLDRSKTQITHDQNLAREPRDHVTFTGTPIIARGKLTLPADSVRWLCALLRSAQIAGAAAACLEMSVKYTSEREQFGRMLSQFQAIQHHLAEIAGQMTSVDTLAMAACIALDESGMAHDGRNARFEIAAAKCRASEAVEPITRLSHQVHGAIGFTYEYDLQFLTRRLWSWRAEFGAHGEWGEYLGQVAMAQGGDKLWRYLTG